MASALDIPPSTVQGWKEVGLIPARHQQAVLDAAHAKGIPLSPADFFEKRESGWVPEDIQ